MRRPQHTARPSRVTLKHVAEAAGCHHTTVSRALRGDLSIPEETRTKIKRLATKLGYRPDPYLSGLIAHRFCRSTSRSPATLAWINNWTERDAWRKVSAFQRFFDGARKRAESLGYKLEEFWLATPHLSQAGAVRILQTRRIHGLIYAPLPQPICLTGFDFSDFAAVAIGQSLQLPVLHSVMTDHYQNSVLLVRELRARGYKRIGYISTASIEARTNGRWGSGYTWTASLGSELTAVIPPLYMSRAHPDALGAWMRQYRPDAIMSPCPEVVLRGLCELRLSVPKDVGLASVAVNDSSGDIAGIAENSDLIGAAAVDAVQEMLHKNERGVPAMPRHSMFAGTWIDGASLAAAPARGGVFVA